MALNVALYSSPELTAARKELTTWLTINGLINSGRMPPTEWETAKAVLELLDKHTTAAQERVDELTPDEVEDPPAEPVTIDPNSELQKIIAARADRGGAVIPDKAEVAG